MKFLASALVLLTPALASAHEGHGITPGTSLAHWILEPAHLPLVLVAVGFVALFARQLLGRSREL